ncbi:MAG: alcohol dehydrogenase catalytic domain-containing protein [Dehalococcoidia bacterium]|nr:alcohol dehydrogenase catalytic domain-containing protein [Dehalococcoidia bacterium]
MKQVVLVAPRHLALIEASAPAPRFGEVLVEVKATAICGTDIHIYTGQTSVVYPRVPGHEFTGIVEQVGEGVTGFSPGDAVALNPNLSCNNCELCILGKENLCPNGLFMGRETDGSLREHLTVPQSLVFKMPSHVSFAEGALIQPLSTVVHGQRRADIKSGESVAVIGQGATGLMHTRLSKLAGAYPVIAVGRSQWKLDLALQMGADFVVSASQGDPVAQVARLTGSLGADVVIEAVGNPDTVRQALDMLKPGGRMLGHGISPQPLPSLDLYRMYRKETTLMFPRALTRADFYMATSLVASKRLDLKPLITREYALEEASAAFRFAEEERLQVLRVVIKP